MKHKRTRKQGSLIPSPNKVNITVYDEDTFYDVYPEATEEDYDKIAEIECTPYTLMNNLEKKMGTKINNIRFISIDGNFFKWLMKNGLKNTQEVRLQYINTMSDEEAEDLWCQIGRDQLTYTLSLPIIFMTNNLFSIPPKTIKVSTEMDNELRIAISDTTGFSQEDIVIIPHMYRIADINTNQETMEDILDNYFIDGIPINRDIKRIDLLGSDKKKVNLYVRAIPIAINEITPFHFTKESALLFENLNPFNDFSEKSLGDIVEKLTKDLNFKGTMIPLSPSLVALEELELVTKDFYITMAKAGAQAGLHVLD